MTFGNIYACCVENIQITYLLKSNIRRIHTPYIPNVFTNNEIRTKYLQRQAKYSISTQHFHDTVSGLTIIIQHYSCNTVEASVQLHVYSCSVFCVVSKLNSTSNPYRCEFNPFKDFYTIYRVLHARVKQNVIYKYHTLTLRT